MLISLHKSVSDLDRSISLRDAAIEAYRMAVRSAAQYSAPLGSQAEREHKAHLEAIAAAVEGLSSSLEFADSQSQFRSELREYHGKTSEYLAALREDLARVGTAMEEILGSTASTCGNQEQQLSEHVSRLERISRISNLDALRAELSSAIASLSATVADVSRKNRQMVAQFREEIATLHRWMEKAEKESQLDRVSGASQPRCFEQALESTLRSGATFSIAYVLVDNFKAIQRSEALTAGRLIKIAVDRLREEFPDAPLARWSDDELVVLLPDTADTISLAKRLAGRLEGEYVCPSRTPPQVERHHLRVRSGVLRCSAVETVASVKSRLQKLIAAVAGKQA